jgi:hypothetical protein
MIAVVFVCMSLHVFGCETEMVNASVTADPAENVEAATSQVRALPTELRAISAPETAAMHPPPLRAKGDENASFTPQPGGTSTKPQGPTADWEASEEMTRTAAVDATIAGENFEADEAHNSHAPGLQNEGIALADLNRESSDSWTNQYETPEASASLNVSSVQTISTIPAVD